MDAGQHHAERGTLRGQDPLSTGPAVGGRDMAAAKVMPSPNTARRH